MPAPLANGPTPAPIRRLLVANRAEIAARVIRSARALGMSTVAVHSEVDAHLPYVGAADLAVPLPGTAAADTYLHVERLVDAALRTGADAVHPGYGFLSERAEFARACLDAGLRFVGPPPDAIERMGSKLTAKHLMVDAGVPVLEDAQVSPADPPETLAAAATRVGFPLLVKAAYGGGGRGMRVVREPDGLADAVAAAAREAAAAFGDGTVFLERYVERPRHVEIQVLADAHGNVASLFERECSIQRRHQKIVEEAPSPAIDAARRAAMGEAACRAATAIGYVNAGTVEFVVDPEGAFWFLEVNTRLQVEHPVTEMVTGLDLVALQLRIAQGEQLPDEVTGARLDGHAIEARLYAEDVDAGYLPVSGVLRRCAFPPEGAHPGVRVDAGYATGTLVSPHYDAMLAKVIAWAPTRHEAAARLAGALRDVQVHGIVTNRDLLVGIVEHPEFLAGATDTGFLDRHDSATLAVRPSADARARAVVGAALAGSVAATVGSPVPAGIPRSWRNVGPAAQPVAYRDAQGTTTVDVVANPGPGEVRLDGTPEPVVVHDLAADRVDLELRGVRVRLSVHAVDGTVYVDGPEGAVVLAEEPRFPPPEVDDVPGSLVAPMPGAVVAVPATVGAAVARGAVLVTLEAMKMEHAVRAPADGVVSEVRVAIGDQVETGDLLVVLVVDAGGVGDAGDADGGIRGEVGEAR